METLMNNGICRCCASEGTFKDVTSKYHWMGEEEIYSDMLRYCFDINLTKSESGNDGGICEVCITQLRNAANFKKQVLHTEEQFKKGLQEKLLKSTIVKVEEVCRDDGTESDNNLSEDYSGAEYDVPIKEESHEEQKPKKRAAKATTSRAKKTKTEAETSTKRSQRRTKVITIQPKHPIRVKLIARRTEDGATTDLHLTRPFQISENRKNQHNLRNILLNSNASPIKGKDSFDYMCAVCPKRFPEPTNLKKHFLEEHNSEKVIKTMSSKICEQIVKLDITYLNCALCDQDLPRLDDLTEHLMKEHKKPMYTDLKSLIVPFVFDSAKLRCAVCSVQYSSFKILQEHMNLHFKNYICDVCSAGFVTKRLLARHETRHGSGTYDCKHCGKTYVSEQKRRDHVKRSHLGFKRNKCQLCPERFADYWQKIDHMTTKHGVPRIILSCQACERTFSNQRSLARHTKKDHLLERKHKCNECEMMFYGKHSLQKHMTKHTGVREFKCDVCFKAYGRKNTLREHMRIHANDRRFSCAHCGQTFVQKCSMKSHMRTKHGEKCK